MKTLAKILLLMVACWGLASCGGDDNDGPAGSVTPEDLAFTVNSDSIEASGKDEALFKVFYKGKDVTAQSKIVLKETQEVISNKIFTSAKLGTYTFGASYRSVNTQDLTLRVVPEKLFLKNVLLMDFTSQACPGCPTMTYVIEELLQQEPERLNFMAVHLPMGDQPDSMALRHIGEPLGDLLGIEKFPTANADMKENFVGARPVEIFKPQLDVHLNGRGDVGIALSVTVANEKANLEIQVKASKAYSESSTLCIAILEDGMKYAQKQGVAGGGEIIIPDYIHNYVVRKYETNIYGDAILPAQLANGNTYKRSLTFNMPSDMTGKVSVVVYVMDSKNKVVNSRRVRVPGSNDFQPVVYTIK